MGLARLSSDAPTAACCASLQLSNQRANGSILLLLLLLLLLGIGIGDGGDASVASSITQQLDVITIGVLYNNNNNNNNNNEDNNNNRQQMTTNHQTRFCDAQINMNIYKQPANDGLCRIYKP